MFVTTRGASRRYKLLQTTNEISELRAEGLLLTAEKKNHTVVFQVFSAFLDSPF